MGVRAGTQVGTGNKKHEEILLAGWLRFMFIEILDHPGPPAWGMVLHAVS